MDSKKIENAKLAIQTQLRMARSVKEASRNALMEYLPEHMITTLELFEISSGNAAMHEFQLETFQKVIDDLNKEE